MPQKKEYKVISGPKGSFEKELDEAVNNGLVLIGPMSVTEYDCYTFYHQMVLKITNTVS